MSWTANSLRMLRLELGWSQAEMGRRLGMNLERWQAVEQGENTLDPEAEISLMRLTANLRDYSRSLQFASLSDSHIKNQNLNQISNFDIDLYDE